MAAKSKRTPLRARAQAATKSAITANSAGSETATVRTTPVAPKKAKRIAKHSLLLNRVRESGIRKAENAGSKKRRRAKPIGAVGEVSDLRGALDDIVSEDEDAHWEGLSDNDNEYEEDVDGDTAIAGAGLRKARVRRRRKANAGEGKMVMKSLSSRPGAAKRRVVMEGRERERFGRNLAQMAAVNSASRDTGISAGTVGNAEYTTNTDPSGQSEKWAALRKFIGGSMVQNKAFKQALG